MTKLSIVMPAYNEERTLRDVVTKVLGVQWPRDIEVELIIVNDGSKDQTWQIMQDLAREHSRVHIFDNPQNLGKSQTVKRAILESTGDLVVIQDADLEYVPAELVDLLDKMRSENLDVVYGNRFGKKNKVIYWQNFYGNKFVTLISNIFTYPRLRTYIPDMEVCYKLIRGDVAREIAAQITATSTFGLEPEITARLARYKLDGKRLKFGIVPISYLPRSIAEGKKMHAFRDGFKAMWEIVKYNLF